MCLEHTDQQPSSVTDDIRMVRALRALAQVALSRSDESVRVVVAVLARCRCSWLQGRLQGDPGAQVRQQQQAERPRRREAFAVAGLRHAGDAR